MIDRARIRLDRARQHLDDPRATFGALQRRLGALHTTLGQTAYRTLRVERHRLRELTKRLEQQDARRSLERVRRALTAHRARLEASGHAITHRRRVDFSRLATRLEGLSPLGILSRGYAIAFSDRTRRAVRKASEVVPGEELRVRVHDGEIRATVKS